MNPKENIKGREETVRHLRNQVDALISSGMFDPARADLEREISKDVFRELGSIGALALQVDPARGGLGLCALDAVRILEHLGSIDVSLASCVAVQNYLTGLPIRRHARKDSQDDLIQRMLAGDCLVAYALTEASGGSDPRRVRSRAEQLENGQWRFSGTKIWSGMAAWAGAFCTFGHAYGSDGALLGMTGFVIPADRDGVTCGQETVTMGLRGMVRNEVVFDGVILEQSDLLGQVGRGKEIARETMSLMRLFMSAVALGAAKRAYLMALRYLDTRHISAGAMNANPVVLAKLDRAASLLSSMDCLLVESARATDESVECLDELYLACKIVVSEWSGEVVDLAMQLMGGRGYVEKCGMPRIYRDLRAFRIIEGPTEALASHLGGVFLIDPARFRTSDLYHRDPIMLGPIYQILESKAHLSRAKSGESASREMILYDRYRLGILIALAWTSVATSTAPSADEGARSLAKDRLSRFQEDEFTQPLPDFRQILERARTVAQSVDSESYPYPEIDPETGVYHH